MSPKLLQFIRLSFITMSVSNANAMLFDTHTMAGYCDQYIKLITLQDDVDHYQAGLCMGYISSKVELMSYTEQLCERDKLNINNIIERFVDQVDRASEPAAAIQVVVDVLEKQHGCK